MNQRCLLGFGPGQITQGLPRIHISRSPRISLSEATMLAVQDSLSTIITDWFKEKSLEAHGARKWLKASASWKSENSVINPPLLIRLPEPLNSSSSPPSSLNGLRLSQPPADTSLWMDGTPEDVRSLEYSTPSGNTSLPVLAVLPLLLTVITVPSVLISQSRTGSFTTSPPSETLFRKWPPPPNLLIILSWVPPLHLKLNNYTTRSQFVDQRVLGGWKRNRVKPNEYTLLQLPETGFEISLPAGVDQPLDHLFINQIRITHHITMILLNLPLGWFTNGCRLVTKWMNKTSAHSVQTQPSSEPNFDRFKQVQTCHWSFFQSSFVDQPLFQVKLTVYHHPSPHPIFYTSSLLYTQIYSWMASTNPDGLIAECMASCFLVQRIHIMATNIDCFLRLSATRSWCRWYCLCLLGLSWQNNFETQIDSVTLPGGSTSQTLWNVVNSLHHSCHIHITWRKQSITTWIGYATWKQCRTTWIEYNWNR